MKHPALTGAYSTAVGRLPESSCMSLHMDAALGAVADAGLKMSDIDGLLCAYSTTEPHMLLSSLVAEYLGIQPAYAASLSVGGATACIMVMTAAALVSQGHCRHVLVVTGDNRLSGMGRAAQGMLAAGGSQEFEQPYGPSVPAFYALVARRYMHEYGLMPEHMASVATTQRAYAALHPLAHMRQPLALGQAMSARLVSSPLRLFDCCPVSDGAAAVIVSAPDAAADTAALPIHVIGSGQGHTHEHVVSAPSLTDFGCKQSSRTTFARAGIRPADIDVAEIYDSFTITLLVELESMGFFERGEAGPAALAGELGVNGRLACNTHGGLLSYGHSGAAGGMFHVVEAVSQLRGQAQERQVRDARIAMVHGDGGVLSAHCSLILARA
ncbi:thiolase family protein [Cupriavidus necator]